jgi:tetratricopeptide (TPR) repeat protein
MRELGSRVEMTAMLVQATVEAYVNASAEATAREIHAVDLAREGARLTDEEAEQLEREIANETSANPQHAFLAQLDHRIMLLGKYSSYRFMPGKEKQLELYLEHAVWVVENAPEHPIAGSPFISFTNSIAEHKQGYERIKSIWLRQIDRSPNNVALLKNAAAFFIHDDKAVAERCLTKGVTLRPNDIKLRHRISHFYSLWDEHEQQALEHLEKALELSRNDRERLHHLSDLPERAFAADDYKKATKFADRALSLVARLRANDQFDDFGDVINHSHTTLGRVALKRGDIKSARFHLALSAVGIASPCNNSFGPASELAAEMVEAGENVSVLQYLDECERLCGPDKRGFFELRFRIEHPSLTVKDNRDQFEEAFLKRQIDALSSWSPADREKHLASAIKWTKGQIERYRIYQIQSEESNKPEAAVAARCIVDREERHLQNLLDIK